ncbi:DUF4879 domain-containing protein [Pseudoalteromonas rubra]|uniref:DUF4879 domain-containing protein n=1 Tax=Pseudoalteromonas rubra TaxID=43658 RepID=UPI001F0C31C9|nr:DUF4879 domain-containing protein [Pseudoalteromonas rubra]
MKNMRNAVLGLAIVMSGSALAGDIENGIMKNAENYYGIEFSNSDLVKQAPEFRETTKQYPRFDVQPMAPATGISYFEFGLVRSQQGGDQTILAGDFSTGSTNHGGSYLFVYAWQVGYGNPNNATMNGLSKSAALREARCGSNLHRCQAGETVTGWLYGWDFTGQSAGQVKASANSVASPFGYWSDSLYIN